MLAFLRDCCHTFNQFAGIGLMLLAVLGFVSLFFSPRIRLWIAGVMLKAIGENPDDFR